MILKFSVFNFFDFYLGLVVIFLNFYFMRRQIIWFKNGNLVLQFCMFLDINYKELYKEESKDKDGDILRNNYRVKGYFKF